jgi:hypothetical protein
MIALRLVRGVTGHFVGRWPEWILSAILFSLGCKLLGSGDTFASGSGFNVMAKVATEEHWGIFLCSVSGARLVALVINGTFAPFARLSPIVRSALGAMSGFAWFAIALGIYLANPEGWGYLTYSGLLVADMINAMLAGGDAGASERRFRHGRNG